MGNQLEFIDCPKCGKRVLTTARQCHHCKHSRGPAQAKRPKQQLTRPDRSPEADEEELSEHASLEHGGYDHHDDFDYDNYLAEEFPDQTEQTPKRRVKLWVWITAWLLILATLLPFML